MSCSEDQVVRIWDTEKDEALFNLLGHTGLVFACVWHPTKVCRFVLKAHWCKENLLVSGSSDQTVKVWDSINNNSNTSRVVSSVSESTICFMSSQNRFDVVPVNKIIDDGTRSKIMKLLGLL
jgi:WD40 repeat protein